jgi:hypothetical protein
MSEATKDAPKWKRFERLAYEIQTEFAGSATVTLDDSIQGVDSKTSRQIDISVRQNIGQYSVLIVIDCKDYKNPVDVKSVEEFAGMVRDVRANRGALISSNGFTEAAINVAKNHGIETFRLVDTESVDWKSYAAVTALLERTFVRGFQLEFVATGRFVLPYAAEELADLALKSGDGSDLGTAKTILHKKWDAQEIPHEPGAYEVLVGKSLVINYRDVTSTVDVSATVIVGREFFLGPIPISVRGLHDEQRGGIITRKVRTDMIDPHLIEQGNVPGWTKLEDDSHLAVKVTMRLAYSNLYCQYPEENPDGEVTGLPEFGH